MAATGEWDTDEPSQEEGGGAVINDSVEKLYTAWRTEVNAPEILPFKQELVEEMQQVLKNQEVSQVPAAFTRQEKLTRPFSQGLYRGANRIHQRERLLHCHAVSDGH